MNTATTLALLTLAAVLEAGGDALVRQGIHRTDASARWLFLLSGGIVLFAYGYSVNTPPWDFGRLLGVYVVLFFVVAQIIAWLAFGQKPSVSIMIGGVFVLVGGVIMTAGSRP